MPRDQVRRRGLKLFTKLILILLYSIRSMAWAELYVFFGTMFRQLDMAVVDTRFVFLLWTNYNRTSAHTSHSYEDLADFYDYFIPIHKGRHLHIHAKPSISL